MQVTRDGLWLRRKTVFFRRNHKNISLAEVDSARTACVGVDAQETVEAQNRALRAGGS